MKELVNTIHDSNAFGSIYDYGTDQGLFRILWETPGASNTISSAHSDYSKERQNELYGFDPNRRSVSKELVLKIVDNWEHLISVRESIKRENFVFASSWQLGKGISNHCWVACKFNNVLGVFHLTLELNQANKSVEYLRKYATEIITKHHLDILHYMIHGDLNSIQPEFIDYAVINGNIDYNLLFKQDGNGTIVFDSEHNMVRLEKYRDFPTIGVYKGSFNPLHDGHLEVVNQFKLAHPDIPVVFMINLSTYDKGRLVDYNNIKLRIQALNLKGYDVIVNEPSNFIVTDRVLKWRLGFDKRIIYLMGHDTFDRIEKQDVDRLKDLFVIQRIGDISSTKLRENGKGYN